MAKAVATPLQCSPAVVLPKSVPVRWLLLSLLCCTLWLAACTEKRAEKPKTAPAVPVAVAIAMHRTVPVQIRTIGTVEAAATVGIKPRIMGELMEVHFKEGDDVKRGDLLFTIDPRHQPDHPAVQFESQSGRRSPGCAGRHCAQSEAITAGHAQPALLQEG